MGKVPQSYLSLAVVIISTLFIASIPASSGQPYVSIYPPESEIGPDLPKAVAEWTFIQYHDADNNLGVYAYEDLVEMMDVGSSDDVNVVVLYDTYEGPAISYYIQKGAAYRLNDYGEVDMGDPNTVSVFLDYVLDNFPAKHYFLCIWDHGDDFRGSCKDYNTDDPAEPRGFLYHSELVPVLDQMNSNISKKLDILAFDACIEGMIEVSYYYKDSASYLIGSEDYVPYHGFPYDSLIGRLEDSPTTTTDDFAKIVVDEYMNRYLKPNGNGGGGYVEAFPTISSIQLNATDDLVNKLDDFANLLESDIKSYKGIITSARAKSILNMPIYGWDADVDLYTFVSEVGSRSSDQNLKDTAKRITDLWDVSPSFIYTRCSHQYEVKSAHGLGVFYPPSSGSILHNKMLTADYYFSDVPFAETGWGKMLKAFFGIP